MTPEQVREIAAELGLNQKQLGERLGLARGSVNRIMHENQGITETVKRLLVALLLIERSNMRGKYEKLLDEYDNVTP